MGSCATICAASTVITLEKHCETTGELMIELLKAFLWGDAKGALRYVGHVLTFGLSESCTKLGVHWDLFLFSVFFYWLLISGIKEVNDHAKPEEPNEEAVFVTPV